MSAFDDTEFLRQGLTHYPDARETVDHFEDVLKHAMSGAFKTKAAWASARPQGAVGAPQFGNVTGTSERYIAVWMSAEAMLSGGAPEPLWVYLGVFWNCRFAKARVVATAYATVGRGALVPLPDVAFADTRLSIGPLLRKNERRIAMDASEDFAPDEAFAVLLDAIDQALASRGYRGPGAQASAEN